MIETIAAIKPEFWECFCIFSIKNNFIKSTLSLRKTFLLRRDVFNFYPYFRLHFELLPKMQQLNPAPIHPLQICFLIRHTAKPRKNRRKIKQLIDKSEFITANVFYQLYFPDLNPLHRNQ